MKIRIIACLMAVALLLTGASVWEGAAAVAPGSELPETGFYTATNSFPRNTVVDITNLENGKSVRVIVAAGLESSGLLAVLSGSAAESIGLLNSSIGRIRMSQPSDQFAYSRFKEGMASSAVPAAAPQTAFAGDTAAVPQEDYAAQNAAETVYGNGGEDSEYTTEAESADEGNYTTGAAQYTALSADTGGNAVSQYEPEPETGLYPVAYNMEPEWEYDIYDETADIPNVFSPPLAGGDEGIERNAAPLYIAQAYRNSLSLDEPQIFLSEFEETPVSPSQPAGPSPSASTPPAGGDNYQYSLVPSEERLPEAGQQHVIAPENIIPPVESPSGIPLYNEGYTYVPVIPPSSSPTPVYAPPSDFSPFAVPLISSLEQGKFYVQLGAFSRAEVVEDELARIGASYPLVVQNIGTDEKPVFRILLGPLNQGESGAMLQRFKSVGYSDAFVRRN
jgi:cell division septation protein DedD